MVKYILEYVYFYISMYTYIYSNHKVPQKCTDVMEGAD